ncbi:hypothetical protein PLICRDRAFT_176793 [Plicaturopsis crispa FD-325 SS-3]|nr:hypothetical protein PLICRDRAFT_176793 [Plicaturopsis crispa FD-325 SS-3]
MASTREARILAQEANQLLQRQRGSEPTARETRRNNRVRGSVLAQASAEPPARAVSDSGSTSPLSSLSSDNNESTVSTSAVAPGPLSSDTENADATVRRLIETQNTYNELENDSLGALGDNETSGPVQGCLTEDEYYAEQWINYNPSVDAHRTTGQPALNPVPLPRSPRPPLHMQVPAAPIQPAPALPSSTLSSNALSASQPHSLSDLFFYRPSQISQSVTTTSQPSSSTQFTSAPSSLGSSSVTPHIATGAVTPSSSLGPAPHILSAIFLAIGSPAGLCQDDLIKNVEIPSLTLDVLHILDALEKHAHVNTLFHTIYDDAEAYWVATSAVPLPLSDPTHRHVIRGFTNIGKLSNITDVEPAQRMLHPADNLDPCTVLLRRRQHIAGDMPIYVLYITAPPPRLMSAIPAPLGAAQGNIDPEVKDFLDTTFASEKNVLQQIVMTNPPIYASAYRHVLTIQTIAKVMQSLRMSSNRPQVNGQTPNGRSFGVVDLGLWASHQPGNWGNMRTGVKDMYRARAFLQSHTRDADEEILYQQLNHLLHDDALPITEADRQARDVHLGGMGGRMRQPGNLKSGLTFDHILRRLQGKLQHSRETGAELTGLTGAMGKIRDTLGPPNGPPYPPNLRTLQQHRLSSSMENQQQQYPALGTLQGQLAETQSALAGHVEKMRGLKGLLAHEAMKHEVSRLKADTIHSFSASLALYAHIFHAIFDSSVPRRHHRRAATYTTTLTQQLRTYYTVLGKFCKMTADPENDDLARIHEDDGRSLTGMRADSRRTSTLRSCSGSCGCSPQKKNWPEKPKRNTPPSSPPSSHISSLPAATHTPTRCPTTSTSPSPSTPPSPTHTPSRPATGPIRSTTCPPSSSPPSTSSPSRPHARAPPSPRTRTTTSPPCASCPALAPAAQLLYFARKQRVPVAVPPHFPIDRADTLRCGMDRVCITQEDVRNFNGSGGVVLPGGKSASPGAKSPRKTEWKHGQAIYNCPRAENLAASAPPSVDVPPLLRDGVLVHVVPVPSPAPLCSSPASSTTSPPSSSRTPATAFFRGVYVKHRAQFARCCAWACCVHALDDHTVPDKRALPDERALPLSEKLRITRFDEINSSSAAPAAGHVPVAYHCDKGIK